MSDSTGTQAATPQQVQRSAALSALGSERQDAAGRYELRGEIARGGMGVVVRAWDNVLKREVAVKLLHPQMVGSHAEKQFLEEANITGQLQHPGIPPVYDLGTFADGRPFLAMKLVNGRTFDALLKESPDDRGRWVGVFEGICQAVGYAHANGVIHRDLKPQNVMVGAFGEVQVMDWGLAKVLASGGRQPLDSQADPNAPSADTKVGSNDTPFHNPRGDSETVAGHAMGTPAYMPPEQARGDVAAIDERSDVFGLGAILCVILTGRPPFAGSDAYSAFRQATENELSAALVAINGCGAEPELIALAKRCLSPDPAARPTNGAAVAEEVAKLREEAAKRARQAETDRAKAEVRSGEWRKRRRTRVAALSVMGLAAAGAAGFAFWAHGFAEDAAAWKHYREAEDKRKSDEHELPAENPELIELGNTLHKRIADCTDRARAAGRRGDWAECWRRYDEAETCVLAQLEYEQKRGIVATTITTLFTSRFELELDRAQYKKAVATVMRYEAVARHKSDYLTAAQFRTRLVADVTPLRSAFAEGLMRECHDAAIRNLYKAELRGEIDLLSVTEAEYRHLEKSVSFDKLVHDLADSALETAFDTSEERGKIGQIDGMFVGMGVHKSRLAVAYAGLSQRLPAYRGYYADIALRLVALVKTHYPAAYPRLVHDPRLGHLHTELRYLEIVGDPENRPPAPREIAPQPREASGGR